MKECGREAGTGRKEAVKGLLTTRYRCRQLDLVPLESSKRKSRTTAELSKPKGKEAGVLPPTPHLSWFEESF